MDSEMMRAIEADGEKLRNLTGEDHGPYFLYDDGDVKCVNAHDRCHGGAGGPCPYCERPVVAPQQPRAADVNKADAFRNMFAILHNVAMWDLEEAGIIRKGDDAKWKRFNDDLTTFVLKLDDARLEALYALITSRQPERHRGIV